MSNRKIGFGFALWCVGLLASANAWCVAGVVAIEPAQPKANEAVTLVVEPFPGLRINPMRFANGRFVIDMSLQADPPNEVGVRFIRIPLGRLPAGTYQAGVTIPFHAPIREDLVFTVAGPTTTDGQLNYTVHDVVGLWWDPRHSGDGVTISASSNGQLFATLYLAGSEGSSPWFVIQGCEFQLNRCEAPVYAATRDETGRLSVSERGRVFLSARSPDSIQMRFRLGFLPEQIYDLERLGH